jgi:hypothetical protein
VKPSVGHFFKGNTGSTHGARRPDVNTHARGAQFVSFGIGTKLGTSRYNGDVCPQKTVRQHLASHQRNTIPPKLGLGVVLFME